MGDDRVFAKCAWRLIPFMLLLYVVSYIDRVNIGFAALTMNKDLDFSPAVYGFGAGVFFISYFLFQVPSNVILEQVGARRWISCTMAVWGLISAANAFVASPLSFYTLRFLLGVAEAGFAPGMVLYLTKWFPEEHRARPIALFMSGVPLSFVIGGPVSGLVLRMDGLAGLHGWQWLFLVEALPAFLLAFAVLEFFPNGPLEASWLTSEEKITITARVTAEDGVKNCDLQQALRDPRILTLGVVSFCNLCALFGIQFWLPQIVQGMGFSNLATGFVIALPAVAAICAMYLWAWSSDKRGDRIWHLAVAMLLTAASLIVASLSQVDSVLLVALSFAFVGPIAAIPMTHSLPSSFLRGPAAAGGIALYNAIANLGGFAGPYIIGVFKEGSGTYASAMAALAFGLVFGALLALALGRALRPNSLAIKQTI